MYTACISREFLLHYYYCSKARTEMCTTPTVHTSALVNTNKLFEYAQKASVRTLGVHLYQQYLNTFNPKWRKKTSWLATPDT